MNPDTCEEVIQGLVDTLVKGGAILTNYFGNRDFDNPEHINMDKERVKKILVRAGLRPVTTQFWQK